MDSNSKKPYELKHADYFLILAPIIAIILFFIGWLSKNYAVGTILLVGSGQLFSVWIGASIAFIFCTNWERKKAFIQAMWLFFKQLK